MFIFYFYFYFTLIKVCVCVCDALKIVTWHREDKMATFLAMAWDKRELA